MKYKPAAGKAWPTLMVTLSVYAGFLSLTWFYHELPIWAVLPLGAYIIAWHGSLQHEIVHGHPTPSPLLNEVLVLPSLWLWLPFRIYRHEHLRHHRNSRLTDPLDDPESYYIDRRQWRGMNKYQRRFFRFHNTLAGRLLAGPGYAVCRLIKAQARAVYCGDRRSIQAWVLHCAGCAPVLFWIIAVCGIGFFEYIAVFVYPGMALTLLRSFAEHRAAAQVEQRTAAIEAGLLFSLLYLYNNLHVLHHAEPGTPWYRLPARWRQRRAELLQQNGNYRFQGYSDIFRRYGVRAKENPAYPYSS